MFYANEPHCYMDMGLVHALQQRRLELGPNKAASLATGRYVFRIVFRGQ
jgi:hypothetical protein